MNLENGGNKMKKSKKKVASTMDERASVDQRRIFC